MSNMLGGGTAAQQAQQYTGIPIQTSALGGVLPLVFGVCRVSFNLMDYVAFTQGGPNTKPGGSVVAKGQSQQGYTASVVMGLCAGGPVGIDSLGTIWVNNGTTGISGFGTLFTGSYSQSPWGYLTSNFPGHDLNYHGIAYVGVQNMDLGSSAQLPACSFEVRGILTNSISPISDADPSQVVSFLLTDPEEGCGFPSARLADLTASGPLGAASFQNYTLAQGLVMSIAYTNQQTVASMLDDMAAAANSAVIWTGTQMNVVPFGDSVVSGNGKTFTPNLTPVATLTNDYFVPDQGGGGVTPAEDPIAWTHKRSADRYNHIRVDFNDASNSYNTGTVEYKFETLIQRYGERLKSGSGTRHFRSGTAAYLSAQLLLQRDMIMDTCTFATDARGCQFDLMDIINVPDPDGNLVPVRILEITQQDDDSFSFMCEALVQGSGTAVLNNFQPSSSNGINTNVVPNSVNTPMLYEPPIGLSGVQQIWAGASPLSADPNWGGCDVYVSIDGLNYTQIGSIVGTCQQGVLSGSFASYGGTNPDTINSPTFDLSMSGGVLQNGTAQQASTLTTLCLVDTELFSYQTSTLVGSNKYQLSTALYRGLYGTAAASHSNGAPFMRLDGQIVKWNVPPRYVGSTVHFKFPSRNKYGAAPQSLAAATDYTIVP